MHEPVAYTYEADYHCERCAEKRFGRDKDGFITGIDNGGNEVGAVFSWDEWYANDLYEGPQTATLVCGTCGETIENLELWGVGG